MGTKDERSNKGTGILVSRLDHPVYLSYFGEGLVLAPRAITSSKIRKVGLGALPRGVIFIPNK